MYFPQGTKIRRRQGKLFSPLSHGATGLARLREHRHTHTLSLSPPYPTNQDANVPAPGAPGRRGLMRRR